jgi:hypothetical protein
MRQQNEQLADEKQRAVYSCANESEEPLSVPVENPSVSFVLGESL